jgi:hypothetical protein
MPCERRCRRISACPSGCATSTLSRACACCDTARRCAGSFSSPSSRSSPFSWETYCRFHPSTELATSAALAAAWLLDPYHRACHLLLCCLPCGCGRVPHRS